MSENIVNLSQVNKTPLSKVKIKKYSLKWTISIIRGLFIIGVCFVILYPLFGKIMASMMNYTDLYNPLVKFIPSSYTFRNYDDAFTLFGEWDVFINTFLLTLAVGILQMISATLIGYGFSRYKFVGRGLIFTVVIIALVCPPDLFIGPRYSLFMMFKLQKTIWPTVLFALTSTGLKASLFIFMMRQFFRGMPKELEEAAYVDGAGPLQGFIRIMIPSAIPMMITVFLFCFVWQWTDSSYSSIFLRETNVITTTINNFEPGWGATGRRIAELSLAKNAGIVIVIMPLLALYMFTQRYFVESITRSGLVG